MAQTGSYGAGIPAQTRPTRLFDLISSCSDALNELEVKVDTAFGKLVEPPGPSSGAVPTPRPPVAQEQLLQLLQRIGTLNERMDRINDMVGG